MEFAEQETPLHCNESKYSSSLPSSIPSPCTRGSARELLPLAGTHASAEEVSFRPLAHYAVNAAFANASVPTSELQMHAAGDGACEPSWQSKWLQISRPLPLKRSSTDSSLILPTEHPLQLLEQFGVPEQTARNGSASEVLQSLYEMNKLQHAFEHVLDLALMRLDPEGQEVRTVLSSKRVQRSIAALGLNLNELALRNDNVLTDDLKDVLKAAVKNVSAQMPSNATRDAKRMRKSRQNSKSDLQNVAAQHVKSEL